MDILKNTINSYTQTVGKRTEVDEIIKVALMFQRAFGVHVLDPSWTWRKYYLFQIINLLLLTYVFFGTLEVLKTSNDIEKIAEAANTLILVVMFTIKLLLFINNRFVFRELFVAAKTSTMLAIKESRKLNNFLLSSKKITYTICFLMMLPAVAYELIALWDYVEGRDVLLSKTTETLLPKASPYNELAWFIHSIFLVELSTTLVQDLWFILLINFLCAASDNLIRILDVKKGEFETTESYSKHFNNTLKLFYKGHVEQTKYLNLMNKMYKWLSFVPLCNASMSICIYLLLLSKEIKPVVVILLTPMFIEIYAYNYFGEMIKIKIEELNMSLLEFNWTSLEGRDRKNYYIIVSYMNKEFGIKTGNGSFLSLITMTAVLKASYQSFTVLQSINE